MLSHVHRTALAVLVTLSLLAGAPPAGVAEEGDAEFAYAAGYFKKQRWKYAAEALKEFLDKHPKHSRAHMALLYYGLALNSMDDFSPARAALEKFIAEYPASRNIADARFHVGECSYNLREYEKAVTDLSLYLEKHEGHNLRGWAVLMLGESQNELQQWGEAEKNLRTLLNSSPDSRIEPDAMFALGVSLQGQQQSQEAVTLFEKVIATRSPALTYARVGTTHFNNGDYEKASAAYDEIVKRFPDKSMAATAALKSGISQFQLKQYADALVRFAKVSADGAVGIHAAMWSGFCHRELGQTDDARKKLSEAFAAAGESPLAAEILFNRAQVEVIDRQKATAAQMFLDLADRWPKDPRVGDSLFNAAQLKMELADLPASRRILDRLQADFPGRAAEPAVRVLTGRLLLKNDQAKEAIPLLRAAAKAPAASTREQLFRSYHLVRALHRGGEYGEAVTVFESMRPSLNSQETGEFGDAAALAAMSSLELKQFAKAKQFANDYLALEQNPEKHSDALAARAVASGFLKEFDSAQSDLGKLIQNFPGNDQTWMAVLQCAESAWQQKEYEQAAAMFELAADDQQKAISEQVHESAVSGAAWSRYRLGQFSKAAALFQQIYSRHPESTGATEAAYMEAMSFFDSEDRKTASARFLALYEMLDQKTSLDEDQTRYMLDAGQMHAKILGQAGQVDDADKVWERLATKFADADRQDEILDSWAFLNLQNGRYDRSDRIYQQLLDQFPGSKFAGQARLSLAESEMQANRLDAALQEFIAIIGEADYGDSEKEAALYHIVDIHAAQREWPAVMKFGEMFADQFSASVHAPNVQLLYAEALLDQKQYNAARDKLAALRQGILDGALQPDEWTERIWIVYAEVALADKRYADIDVIEKEFVSRTPQSRFLFQMYDVLGRRWKIQPNPDFPKARDYFAKVTTDETGRGTETAARCQFLIAETFLLEQNYDSALKEYYRVYLNYPFDEWRVRGLFQAAGCEIAVGDVDAAKRSYQDLLKDFPGSEWAKQADAKLKELTGAKK